MKSDTLQQKLSSLRKQEEGSESLPSEQISHVDKVISIFTDAGLEGDFKVLAELMLSGRDFDEEVE